MVFKVFSVAKICLKPQSAPLMNLASNVAQLLLNTYKHHETVVPFIFSILCLCLDQGIVTSYLCDIFLWHFYFHYQFSQKNSKKRYDSENKILENLGFMDWGRSLLSTFEKFVPVHIVEVLLQANICANVSKILKSKYLSNNKQ